MNNAIRIALSLGLLYGLATESGVFTTMFCLFVLMNIECMIIIIKRIIMMSNFEQPNDGGE